jgi:hypothetical protein
MTHTLDVVEGLFNLLEGETKSFILLKDDRNYVAGDIIVFQVLDQRKEFKTEVSYLEIETPGLKNGYILLGLKQKENW